MNILKLTPSCKDYLWGGSRLRSDFGIKSDLNPLAEAWVLSCHPDGPSYLADGTTLADYVTAHPGCLGTDCEKFEQFPILTKFIDAKNNLSIQVHPSNEYALKNEHQYGKTEMWYVLDCEPGAFLYYGFDHEISKAEFEERIKNNTLTEVLNAVPVHKGDCFFIPAGTLHAICKGIVIAEVQQNSNVTYRVYLDGNVILGVNELGQNGEHFKLFAVCSRRFRVGGQVVRQHGAVRQIAGAIGMAGKHPGFRQRVQIALHAKVGAQAAATPKVILAGWGQF